MSDGDLWNAAAMILGFQTVSFAWRMSRESKCDPRRFPPSDYLNILSMLVLILGVFVLPLLAISNPQKCARAAFGASLLLFGGYLVASVGHYKLLFKGDVSGGAEFASCQEWIAFWFTIPMAMIWTVVFFFIPGNNL
jgi:hypothetical protein